MNHLWMKKEPCHQIDLGNWRLKLTTRLTTTDNCELSKNYCKMFDNRAFQQPLQIY